MKMKSEMVQIHSRPAGKRLNFPLSHVCYCCLFATYAATVWVISVIRVFVAAHKLSECLLCFIMSVVITMSPKQFRATMNEINAHATRYN